MFQISYFRNQAFRAAGGMPSGEVPLTADTPLEIKEKAETKGHLGNLLLLGGGGGGL